MDNIMIDLKRVDNRVHLEATSTAHPALPMPLDTHRRLAPIRGSPGWRRY